MAEAVMWMRSAGCTAVATLEAGDTKLAAATTKTVTGKASATRVTSTSVVVVLLLRAVAKEEVTGVTAEAILKMVATASETIAETAVAKSTEATATQQWQQQRW